MKKPFIFRVLTGLMIIFTVNSCEKEKDDTDAFTDTRDQQTYKLVMIGDQVWMAENLKYLPAVSGLATGSETASHYYVYGYDGTDVSAAKATENYQNYGVLYNWSAAMAGASSSSADPSGIQGVCPTGWHLPSDAEWTVMENYLIANGYNFDGTNTGNKIAKALATSSGWSGHTGTGTVGNTDYPDNRNATGFSALPGGYRRTDGSFLHLGEYSSWWSSTEGSSASAGIRRMAYGRGDVGSSYYGKAYGVSVRCVKDTAH